MMTHAAAIDESIVRDCIVTIEGDAALREEMSASADNEVEVEVDRGPGATPGLMTEYWGTADGKPWRVHVVHDDE